MLRKLLPLGESKPANIIGFVDGEVRGRLHGWVLDRAHPSRRLTVVIAGAAGNAIYALADRYRADVHQSGLGDGYSGFSVPMRLVDTAPVRVICSDSGVELASGSADSGRKRSQGQTFARDAYTLHVDSIANGRIVGWAVDGSEPERRRALRLRCRGTVVAQQRATLYRADLAGRGRDGYHGYSFSLPTLAAPLVLEDVGLGAALQVRL